MKKLLVFALLLNALLLAGRFWQELTANAQQACPAGTANGDVNGDGLRDISDAIGMLNWLFLGGPEPCALAEGNDLTPEQAEILSHMSLDGQNLVVTGLNLQIVNGAGSTESTNGVGNLIVGYNESSGQGRSGSHNIVVGAHHGYSSAGGLVAGFRNRVEGKFATVSGGTDGIASGDYSSVSGGRHGHAEGPYSSVTGGGGSDPAAGNVARGEGSSVTGGQYNVAGGIVSTVSGGSHNEATGVVAAVAGGGFNVASGDWSSVTGGGGRDPAAGNRASGYFSSVTGGEGKEADCDHGTVSGANCEVPAPAVPGFAFLSINAQGYPEYRHEQTGIIFVRLPGGTFEMGSPEEECWHESSEGPVHTVTLSPFLMAKYELTQAEWESVMGTNLSYFQGPRRPVEFVSWDEIQEFEARTGLALPTEAQWEYACRAGTRTPFSSGPDLTRVQANFRGNLAYCEDEGNAPDGQFIGETVSVGSRAPNGFGLHDMHGNVWEWCEDVYNFTYYSLPEAAGPNPVCTSGFPRRVYRGGSWSSNALHCRSARRNLGEPSTSDLDIGFRPSWSSP